MSILSLFVKEARALWRDGRGPSLVVVSIGWGLLLGTRMVYPVLLPYLRSSFGLSLTVAGLLVTILWLGAAVGQLPGGILADRYSERLILAVSVILVAVALVLVVTASGAIMLFVSTGLVGLGQSLYPIARITMLSDIYSDRLGSALGVTMATGDLGQTVIPPMAGVFAAAIAWQLSLGFMIPIFLLIGLGLWVALPVQDSSQQSVTLSSETARDVLVDLRQRRIVFVMGILFLYIFIWQSFTGLYPVYLVDKKGLSSSMAGLLFSLFFAVGIVIKPLAGAAYDRIGMRTALLFVLVGPMAGFTILPVADGFWLLAVVTVLISTMLGSGAITQSFLADSFSDDIRGTGLGVIRTGTSMLGATGPVLFGLIADRGYFDEGYLLLAAIMLAVIALTLLVPKPDSGRSRL